MKRPQEIKYKRLTYIDEGSRSTAYLCKKNDYVYIRTTDVCKRITSFVRHPNLPAIEDLCCYADTEKTQFWVKMPFYDNVYELPKEVIELEKINRRLRYKPTTFMKEIKNHPYYEPLRLLYDVHDSFGLRFEFEFPIFNIGFDDDENVILRDVIYSTHSHYEEDSVIKEIDRIRSSGKVDLMTR